nr:PQQ-like beta-propeller repeat protein [Bacteroidota bacterium]
MNTRKQLLSDELIRQNPLRLWPGVVIVMLQWLVRFGIPIVVPDDIVIVIGVFGGLLGGLAIVVWWAFFSRAPRFERWSAVVLMIVALFAISQIIHESIATAMQGLMFAIYAIPVLSLAFVVWAVASSRLSDGLRRMTMVATILLASGVWTLLRTDGMTGDARHDFAWRWAETHEERLLAQTDDEPMSLVATKETGAYWPGFRGLNRDGIIHGVRIKTDWSEAPPVEMWRRPIGPGCSSFAVSGALLYTQEQRGEDEIVSCYNLTNGEPVWRHSDSTRFWDSHAGAGPRSTPTLSGDRVYTLGATGILNVLDASDGAVVWSRNAAFDTDAKLPGWGFASSPLVVDDLVIVAIAGALVAYDIATGEPRWFGPDGGGDSYSSPHLLTIGGIEQILLMSGVGATSFTPFDGTVLWQHPWPSEGRIVQPALTADGDLLLSAGGGKGMRRIAVEHGPEGWEIEERWTSGGLKPSFNDFIIHEGHAFGFVGPILACIDIMDGTRKWKDGRYAGFLILLSDQDLLLVLSEKGDVILVEATPDQFTELAKFQAIVGKTWNHPVLVDDILLIRNTQEMAAFRLALTDG